MIFADEDRLYLYWGLGSAILGAELDPDQPNRFLTTPKVLIRVHPENWWERFGAANEEMCIRDSCPAEQSHHRRDSFILRGWHLEFLVPRDDLFKGPGKVPVAADIAGNPFTE